MSLRIDQTLSLIVSAVAGKNKSVLSDWFLTVIVFNDTFRTNVELVRVRHFGLFVSLSAIQARTNQSRLIGFRQ